MKNVVKKMVVLLLAVLAHLVVRKYKPKIVMVTGSVGKTSTKDALVTVLKSRFYVRGSEKSHNTEFGVPLTVFGLKNPWTSLGGWIKVLKEAIALLLLPNHYPSVLVLEVGADKPGDIARTLEIATPDVVVVTCLPDIPVHVEAYASPEAVREEEFMPAYALPAGAPLVICASDKNARTMSARVSAQLVSFGTDASASVRMKKVGFYEEGGRVVGMQAEIATNEESCVLIVCGSVGETHVLPAAAACAAALSLGVPLAESVTALKDHEPPPGRCRLLDGINNSVIIDDTYNSSPAAVEEALKTLNAFPHARRRIAVLGDMLELGRYSVAEHERIGLLAKEMADVVVGVGIRAKAMGATQNFDDSRSAALALKDFIQEGDVILIKGSQSIRTERIAEALLADPADAKKLVRQDREWKKRG